jgi:hypothetical protein
MILCLFVKSSMFLRFLNSPVAMYVVSNLAPSEILKSHLFFNKAHNFSGVKSGHHLHVFVLFGSLIKIQLNIDLIVQPALLLLLKFLSG